MQAVRKTMCNTCPFKDGSKYEYLRDYLTQASYKEGRLCHSTGENAINETQIEEKICRGSRDIQLNFFTAIKYLPEPTDEAWNNKRGEIGLPIQEVRDE